MISFDLDQEITDQPANSADSNYTLIQDQQQSDPILNQKQLEIQSKKSESKEREEKEFSRLNEAKD